MSKSAFGALKILDMSRYLPGGYVTQVFADFGANVIKVEDVGMGDFCRHEEPLRNDMSYYFTALGRNKKSLSIDLKKSDALQAFYLLVKDADVVVESFRPGNQELKIDYDTLREAGFSDDEINALFYVVGIRFRWYVMVASWALVMSGATVQA